MEDALASLETPKDDQELACLAEELRDTASCRIDALWPSTLADALAQEAKSEWPRASLSLRGRYEADGGCLAGPLLQYWSDKGALLARLHRDPKMISLVQGLSGRPMLPVQAAYLYYQEGGFCGLHTDRPDFEVQLMISVTGDMGPLVIRPDLASVPAWELAQVCTHEGVADGGLELRYPRFGVTVFSGTRVPHHRPPHLTTELGSVAGLNYRSARSP